MPDDSTSSLDQIRAELRVSGATYADESRLLKAVDAVLELTRDSDGDDLYPSIDVTVGEIREAIRAALTGR